jgi:hypothetical protein
MSTFIGSDGTVLVGVNVAERGVSVTVGVVEASVAVADAVGVEDSAVGVDCEGGTMKGVAV